MSRYFYDLEFLEDGETIELISLGMVSEDGREFYGVNRDFTWSRIARRRWYAPWRWEVRHQWLLDNVVEHLPWLHGDARLHYASSAPGALGVIDWRSPEMMSLDRIKAGVLDLVGDDPDVQLWASYGAYDHVRLMQCWGPMMVKPDPLPMWTHDLMQECERHGVHEDELPAQASGNHNALFDARWCRDARQWLQTQHGATEGAAAAGHDA